MRVDKRHRGKPLSEHDQKGLAKFAAYLVDRSKRPNVPAFQVYAEHYGEVVFEDKGDA